MYINMCIYYIYIYMCNHIYYEYIYIYMYTHIHTYICIELSPDGRAPDFRRVHMTVGCARGRGGLLLRIHITIIMILQIIIK